MDDEIDLELARTLRFNPSPSILALKAKALRAHKDKKQDAGAAPTSGPSEEDMAPLIEVYEKHSGDLHAIFAELGDDPGKALKYPPKDAHEFARKYIGGYFTYVNMKRIAARISQVRAAAISEASLVEYMKKGAKKAPEADPSVTEKRKAEETEANKAMIQGLEKLYNDNNGNLDAIFDILGEDPGKAKKYPPKDAHEFATKYLNGGFTYVSVRKQPSGSQVAKAVSSSKEASSDPMVQGLVDLYNKHEGNIEAIFAVLNENPGKALKYPPSDAQTFATKYIEGSYTYASAKPMGKPNTPQVEKAAEPSSPDTVEENPMIAALINLYNEHNGDLTAIFAALGENPKKALKYPPADAKTFAVKYMEGCYTYYTAPETSEESIAARFDQEDEALSPMEVLLMLFPDVEPALLEAAFQEANGHLELTVELLLTAMFFSTLSTGDASVVDHAPNAPGDTTAGPPPPPGGMSELAMNEFNNAVQAGDTNEQVLALTVPPGASAGDLVRFVTPAGAIVAEVPEGVEEGQPFFVRLNSSSS